LLGQVFLCYSDSPVDGIDSSNDLWVSQLGEYDGINHASLLKCRVESARADIILPTHSTEVSNLFILF
jgi:hypothetical protein